MYAKSISKDTSDISMSPEDSNLILNVNLTFTEI